MEDYIYKDSGVEWLGKIPKHWMIDRIKDHFKDDLSQIDAKTLSEIENVNYFSIPAYDNDASCETVAGESIDSGKKVLEGTGLLYSKLNSWKPRVWLYDVRTNDSISVASTEFLGLRPVSPNKQDLRYYQYLLGSELFKNNIVSLLTSVTNSHQRVNPHKFYAQDIPLPSLAEQKAIADYLDIACQKIDRVIEIKKKQISRIREQMESKFVEILTYGNRDEELVDPNIHWLDRIPKSWERKRLKDILDLRSGDSITSESIYPEGDYSVFGGNGLRGYTDNYTHEGYYPLIGRQGALCGNINYAEGKFWASEHAVVAKPARKLDIYWAGELMRMMNLNQYSNAAAQPGLAVQRIKNLYIPYPSYKEQKEISAILKSYKTKIDKEIELLDAQVEKIELFKKSLIYECVTGKKKVFKGAPEGTKAEVA